MFKKLKCLFGFHEWDFMETPFGARHYCIHCGKWLEMKDWKDFLKKERKK